MAYLSRPTSLFVSLLLSGACGRVPNDPNEDPLRQVATTSHPAIEDLAEHKPFPRYPARSLENGAAGVSVASIRFGFDGRMERVDVLEAPDADIADAMRDALGRWVLPQTLFEDDPRGPFKAAATMVFYFLIEGGEGRVVSGPALAAERTAARSVAGEVRRIGAAELEALLETGDVVVVDPRDRELYARGHRDGAINIPEPELQSRAAVELSPAQAVIVDCYRGLEGMCDMAARVLLRLVGVPDVAVFVHN